MNMFIGKYLVDKDYVSQTDVLDALNKEMTSQPSVVQIIRELSLLSDDELIDIAAESSTQKLSILNLIKNKKMLSDDQINTIVSEKLKKGRSLLQILVNDGKLEADKAVSIIREYENLATLDNSSNVDTDETKEIEEVQIASSEPEAITDDDDGEPEVSLAALESLKELGIATEEQLKMLEDNLEKENKSEASSEEKKNDLNEMEAQVEEVSKEVEILSQNIQEAPTSAFLKEYFNQYDDFTYDELMAISKSLINGLDKSKISEAHSYFTELSGAAKLSKLKYSIKLFQGWIKLCEAILEDRIDFAKVNFMKISGTFKKSIKVSKEMRDLLESGKEESDFFNNLDSKKSYLELMKSLLEILETK